MQANIFTEVTILIVLGASIALIVRLLRQPIIVGHILTGIITGPTLLNIVRTDSFFPGLGTIGVALLLFIIGLSLSLNELSRLSKTVIITTLTQMSVVLLSGYIVSQAIGFGRTESAIIGLGLALSSTIVIVKFLSEKKDTTRLYAQILIGILLLQEVLATSAKIVLATKTSGQTSIQDLLFLLGRGVLVTGTLFAITKYVLPQFKRSLEQSKEAQLLLFLGWGLGFAALFKHIGFSVEIGALLAGVSLGSLSFSREVASRLKPLRDFFIIIFFITLGTAMTPHTILDVLPIAAILSVIVLVVKPLSVLVVMGSMGYTKRASFRTAISMSQVSEFSLVFLATALAAGYVSETASATITMVALITLPLSAYFIKYDVSLYQLFEKHLQLFERKKARFEQDAANRSYQIVLFGYRKGGQEFVKTFEAMAKRYLVIDYDPEVIDSLERKHKHFLYGDATDSELLEEMNLSQAKLIVSTIGDHKTNMYLAEWLANHNPRSVYVCSAESAVSAAELYEAGAAYVMLPHYIGSEKISSFIKKNGLNKSEFKRYREKHLLYLQSHLVPKTETE